MFNYRFLMSMLELVITIGVLWVIFHNLLRRGFLGRLALFLLIADLCAIGLTLLLRTEVEPGFDRLPLELFPLAYAYALLSLFSLVAYAGFIPYAYLLKRKGRSALAERPALAVLLVLSWLGSLLLGEFLAYAS